MISAQEKRVWTAWLSVPGIGRETFAKLIGWSEKEKTSLTDLWHQSPSRLLSSRQLDSLHIFQKKFSIDGYWQFLQQQAIKIVTIHDRSYPEKLQQIYDPPWLLFVKGKLKTESNTVGVVGTRRNTLYGKQVTQKIVQELVSCQTTIISGFMYGIDTIAHKQAINAGGKTVAVLGYGFDHVGPASHQQLYQKWLDKPDQVVFISEYPPSRSPRPGLFPLRNRIVAGLSDGVVVTEAAARSGSLITAQLAIDGGRSVCAVPGSIFSRYSQGTRQLINQGACLVTSGHEVLEELGWQFQVNQQTSKQQPVATLEQKIIQELNASPQTIDDLLRLFGVSIEELTARLMDLEIRGVLRKEGVLYHVV